MQERQEHDAGIAGLIAKRTVLLLGYHDGAGAAIALGTAFLGTGHSFNGPKIFEYRHGRTQLAQRPRLISEQKTYSASILHQLPR